MADDPAERLRAICLALPEATEKETWDNPTFRVRDKIFAITRENDEQLEVWLKAPHGAQEILIGAAPEIFFSPPYVGPKGWVGMRLGAETNWDEVSQLVRRSYSMTAPKRLSAKLD